MVSLRQSFLSVSTGALRGYGNFQKIPLVLYLKESFASSKKRDIFLNQAKSGPFMKLDPKSQVPQQRDKRRTKDSQPSGRKMPKAPGKMKWTTDLLTSLGHVTLNTQKPKAILK